MALLIFVSHSNSDNKRKRVIAKSGVAENTIFNVDELSNDKLNKLCDLSTKDVEDIKAWLNNKQGELLNA